MLLGSVALDAGDLASALEWGEESLRIALDIRHVIQGADDEYGTQAQLDAISRGVCGPVETVLLPQCGHSPHRDKPGETLAAMTDFLRRHGQLQKR